VQLHCFWGVIPLLLQLKSIAFGGGKETSHASKGMPT